MLLSIIKSSVLLGYEASGTLKQYLKEVPAHFLRQISIEILHGYTSHFSCG